VFHPCKGHKGDQLLDLLDPQPLTHHGSRTQYVQPCHVVILVYDEDKSSLFPGLTKKETGQLHLLGSNWWTHIAIHDQNRVVVSPEFSTNLSREVDLGPEAVAHALEMLRLPRDPSGIPSGVFPTFVTMVFQKAKADKKAQGKADKKAPPKADKKAPPKADKKAPPKADKKAPPKANHKAPSQTDKKAADRAAAKMMRKAVRKACRVTSMDDAMAKGVVVPLRDDSGKEVGVVITGFYPDQSVPVVITAQGDILDTQFKETDRALSEGENYAVLTAIEQACLSAMLPGAKVVFSAADFHSGYAAPIGTGIFFDLDKDRVVYPGLIGFDIGCGMTSVAFPTFDIEQLRGARDALSDKLLASVPTAFTKQDKMFPVHQIRDILLRGPLALGLPEDVYERCYDTTTFRRCTEADLDRIITQEMLQAARASLGTLGKCNHFIELGKLIELLKLVGADDLGLASGVPIATVHSGSRSFGQKVAASFIARAATASRATFGPDPTGFDPATRDPLDVPTKEFAGLTGDDANDYLLAMECAARFAQASRYYMLLMLQKALQEALGLAALPEMQIVVDCTHNTFKEERQDWPSIQRTIDTHVVTPTASDGLPATRMLVARKGSTSVQNTCNIATIGSSMFGGNYLLRPSPYARSVGYSLPHGAGREHSRKEAREIAPSQEELRQLVADLDIVVATADGDIPQDEVPIAYKDAKDVLESTFAGQVIGHCETIFVLKPEDVASQR
jgi:tRNA-splicing ligase RtcB